MKLFLDFLPLILFFGTFQYADKNKEWAVTVVTAVFGFMVSGGTVGLDEAPILLGTVVMSVVTLIQVVVLKVMKQKIHLMLWITFVLVLVLGGATVYFHNPMIIKWKPSLAYWALGLSFWISRMVFHKNMLQEMLGEEIKLPAAVWQRAHFSWIAFLGLMGLLNLYVAYTFTTSTWATFKVFGATGLTLAFFVGLMVYISRFLEPESEDGDAKTPGNAP